MKNPKYERRAKEMVATGKVESGRTTLKLKHATVSG
jgi:hypothetical protein